MMSKGEHLVKELAKFVKWGEEYVWDPKRFENVEELYSQLKWIQQMKQELRYFILELDKRLSLEADLCKEVLHKDFSSFQKMKATWAKQEEVKKEIMECMDEFILACQSQNKRWALHCIQDIYKKHIDVYSLNTRALSVEQMEQIKADWEEFQQFKKEKNKKSKKQV